MPVSYRAPGVYIQELDSGVHPIVGVATATAAFVDVFQKGTVGKPVKIFGPGDFQREFGGVSADSEASYAIAQFFNNGGSQAWVVRVAGTNSPVAASAKQEASGSVVVTDGTPPDPEDFEVIASAPGSWGNALCFGIQNGLAANTFDLVVGQVAPAGASSNVKVAVREIFRGLSTTPADPRYCVAIVNNSSQLVTLDLGPGTVTQPGPTWNRNTPTATGLPDGAGLTTTTDTSGAGLGDIASQTNVAHFHRLSAGDDGSATDSKAALANMLIGDPVAETGIYALDTIAPDIFNILCIPAMANIDQSDAAGQAAYAGLLTVAGQFCRDHRSMLLVDPPAAWDTISTTTPLIANMVALAPTLSSNVNTNAAVYFPRLVVSDPITGGTKNVGPSGTMAGIWSRIDTTRGVWKAPAGTEATLGGARPVVTMNDGASDTLNPAGVNVLRTLPVFNNVAWGARTLDGADQMASQWKYIPVRRTALYIEESLRQGLQWVVFEPNDEPLWAQIRLNVGSFMQNLFRLGAFAGTTPNEAFLVKCDSDTTTPYDVSTGVVNILVGFQPLLPCEFVVIQIQQLTQPTEA
jgi:phage tail sheath protein FI